MIGRTPTRARVCAFFAVAALVGGCGPGAPVPDVVESDSDGGVNLRDVPFAHPDGGQADDVPLAIFVSDAVRGEGLPCKVTVRGRNGTPTPNWGFGDQEGEWLDAANGALGIGQWVLMARGRARLPLPPGEYEFVVTRGMEYAALVFGPVTVRAGQGLELRGELRRVVDTEGEIAGEFHIHSAPSGDSDVPLDQRVLSLAAEGVEVFASTDHDVLGDFNPAIEALGMGDWIHWIRGVEMSVENVGHFGAYPLPADSNPDDPIPHFGLRLPEVIRRARQSASVLQLNHPLWRDHPIGCWNVNRFDPMTGMSAMDFSGLYDAVEVWNSHTLDQSDAGFSGPDEVIDAWMATLMLGQRTTAMGNTDTHRLAHSPPGWPRTYLRVADDRPGMVTDAMVSAAILAGDASLTSGPFVRFTVNDARPGQTVRASMDRRVTVEVDVQAADWTPVDRVEVYANRRMMAAADVTAAPVDGYRRQRFTFPLTLTRDAFVLVRTRATQPLGDLAGTAFHRPFPSLALANPVYVDADGDGRWSAPRDVRPGP